jgi:hypothetical protein
MADQLNRGGQKQGQSNPNAPEAHRTEKPLSERPAEGKPGGPKPNAGGTRHDKHDKKN